jgi:CubicO group peptidase (beta-lactamase class C family)
MSSGLFSGGDNTVFGLFRRRRRRQCSDQYESGSATGTRWKYANNDTLLAAAFVAPSARGRPQVSSFSIRRAAASARHVSHAHGSRPSGQLRRSSQTYTTARDLARFGMLLANDGVLERQATAAGRLGEVLEHACADQTAASGQWGYGLSSGCWIRCGRTQGTFTPLATRDSSSPSFRVTIW